MRNQNTDVLREALQLIAEETEDPGARECALEALATQPVGQPTTGSWISAESVDALARELDVAMNGEEGAARAPSLCDVVAQAVTLLRGRGGPTRSAEAAPEGGLSFAPESPAPAVAPGPLTDEQIKALAHRSAWRYKKAAEGDGDTYTFNETTLLQFAAALAASGVKEADHA